ncbi:MAG: DUF664 domain-containing protein [Dehalococcoidia bacterium]
MDALKAAAREIFDQCCADLRIAVNGLDAETLSRQPAPETSPLATLIRHSASATRYQLTCAATGRGDRQYYRTVERPGAFEGQPATADALISVIDHLEEDGRRLIEAVPVDHLGERVVFEAETEEGPARAWALLHALEHLREHVGHAQLTRQVLSVEP